MSIIKLSQSARSLWAKKSSKNGNLLWLPLTAHMADSALVARKLWNQWLSDGVRHTIVAGITGEEDTDPQRLFMFLAAVHDLGKATPVFQAKQTFPLCRELDEWIEEEIISTGLPMRPFHEFLNANKTPHALATQVLLIHAGCPGNVAAVLGSHHGKPPELSSLEKYGLNTYAFNYHLEKAGKEEWTAVHSELLNFALELSGFSDIMKIPSPNLESQVLLSGLLIMADWIASNEGYFPYIRLEDKPELLNHKTRMQKAWEKLSIPTPWEAGKEWMRLDLYKERFDFENPRTMQSTVEQTTAAICVPGILVLEAPMGLGKTEAALVCAEIFADKTQRTGVFFALPTQATSDGIFPRIIKWINRLDADNEHSIELAHGRAQFNDEFQSLKHFGGSTNVGEDDESGAFVHQWFEGQKKALLADFVVGTIDQLLLAALKQKHVMLRHLGLAGKVVIIDECHAYDAYMGQYLKRALNWLGAYHVPVIVLSATLPEQKRKMVIDAYLNRDSVPKRKRDPLGRGTSAEDQPLEEWTRSRDYPLITYTDGGRIMQKSVPAEGDAPCKVKMDFLSEGNLADTLDELLSEGGCAGVIVNTVKRAQELTQMLSERFGNKTVRLLHSQFLAPDRMAKENELRMELGKTKKDDERPKKRIVVGTQVLEQSLDIDFDILVTDMCPMDLLLQRIGRLHRHKRIRPIKLEAALCLVMGVNNESFEEGAEVIYGKYLLMRTKAMLPQQIIIPEDIPQLVQNVYDDNLSLVPEPAGYQKAKREQEKQIADKEERASTFQIDLPWTGPSYNLVGWLDTDVSDQRGEAAVRDTDESMEVLLIQEKGDGRVCFLPWLEKGCEIPLDGIPDNKLSKALARQRIRLPRVLCAPWAIDKTIEELECHNSQRLSEWQESPWLKGELFLILDKNFSTRLSGYHLIYNQIYGLLCEKEVDQNA